MRRARKTISAVLAVALFIGLIPSEVSAKSDTSPALSYNFTVSAFNSSFVEAYLQENGTIAMGSAVRTAMTYDAINPNSSALWELDEYVTNNASAKGTIANDQMYLMGDYTEGFYASFKIAVPKSGWYDASTVYNKGRYSGDVNVYLGRASEDASSIIQGENSIGSFDSYSLGTQYGLTCSFGKLYFEEPGEYLLVYVMNSNESTEIYSSNRMYMYLQSFNLSFLQYSNDTANYSFKSTAIGGTGAIYNLSEGYTDYSNIVPALSDNWAYAGRSSNLSTDLNSATKYTIVQHKTTQLYWAALMIDVPKSGSYDVKLTTWQNDTTTISYDVYIIPYTEDVTGAVSSLNASSLVGSVDGDHPDGSGNITHNVGAFTAESEGDYIIIFKGTSANSGYTSGSHCIYLVSLELDGVTDYIAPLPAPPDNEERTDNEHSVMITAANSSAGSIGVPVTITTNLDGYTQGTAKDYGIGTNVIATAPEETEGGQRFKYWIHKGSNRVVTTDTQVTFNLGSNTTLIAVYSDSGEGTLIEFFDKNGKLIKSDYYGEGDTVNYPTELPTAVGYGQATGWSSNPVTAGVNNLAIVAVYNEPIEEYAITVTNGTGAGSYTYNERVTVSAPATDGAQVFSHWTRNGKVTSYSPEYSFYVWDAATLTAHYTYEAVDTVPGIALEDVVKTIGYNRYFMAERFGFNGEEVIESGMLYGTSAELDIDNYGAKVCSISGKTQFLSWTSNDLYKVRAYVIYRDGVNKIRIAYSDIK